MVLTRPDMMSGASPAYDRHKPEQTLLYQLVEHYRPEFQTQLNEIGRFLLRHVTREFEDYLACGRLENGFLRVRCNGCSHEHLVAFSCKRHGFSLQATIPVWFSGWLAEGQGDDPRGTVLLLLLLLLSLLRE